MATKTICDCCGRDMSSPSPLDEAVVTDSSGGNVCRIQVKVTGTSPEHLPDICHLCIIDALSRLDTRPARGRPPRRGTQRSRFLDMVAELVRNGEPAHRSKIIEAAIAGNLFPPTTDFDRTVSKYLTIEPALVPVGNGYWKLAAGRA